MYILQKVFKKIWFLFLIEWIFWSHLWHFFFYNLFDYVHVLLNYFWLSLWYCDFKFYTVYVVKQFYCINYTCCFFFFCLLSVLWQLHKEFLLKHIISFKKFIGKIYSFKKMLYMSKLQMDRKTIFSDFGHINNTLIPRISIQCSRKPTNEVVKLMYIAKLSLNIPLFCHWF